MSEKKNMNEILLEIGQETASRKLDEPENDMEFEGYEKVKERLLNTVKNMENTEQEKAENVQNITNYRPRKKKNVKKRLVLVACVAAVLGISATAYAAVRYFTMQDELVGNGEYKLDIKTEDEADAESGTGKITKIQPIRLTANYIPEGFVSNNADYNDKYRLYPENGEEYGNGGISIIAEAARDTTMQFANVTESEAIGIGEHDGKIMTTFMQDGTEGHNITWIDPEAGYIFTVYGMDSGLSVDELQKIAENLSYETVADAEPIVLEENPEKGDPNMEYQQAGITGENIFKVGETTQDVAANDPDAFTEAEQYDRETAQQHKAQAGVEYTVNKVEVLDQVPEFDESVSKVNSILTENMQEDRTLKAVPDTTAKQNEETGNVETNTTDHPLKFVLIDVTLHNPSDLYITDYCFMTQIQNLVADGEGYVQGEWPIVFNEPVYLGYPVQDEKSAYMMAFAEGETKQVQVGYLVDADSLDTSYIRFNSLGMMGEKCFDKYLKITK